MRDQFWVMVNHICYANIFSLSTFIKKIKIHSSLYCVRGHCMILIFYKKLDKSEGRKKKTKNKKQKNIPLKK